MLCVETLLRTFSLMFGSIRMLRSTHGALLHWAAELWPGVEPSAPSADVEIDPLAEGWRITIPRGRLQELSPESAFPGRTEEARFFLSAFEKRATALERLVRVLVSREPAAFRSGLDPAPIACALVAEDLHRLGQGREAGATPEMLRSLVHRLVEDKTVRTPAGEIALSRFVTFS